MGKNTQEQNTPIMKMKKDSWPQLYFFDVRSKKSVTVDAEKNSIELKKGTKERGTGNYYQMVAHKPNGLSYNLSKLCSEDAYTHIEVVLNLENENRHRVM